MEHPLSHLLKDYDTLVVLDTETTGLDFEQNEIIELAAMAVGLENGQVVVRQEMDQLIYMDASWLSPKITELTGISKEEIDRDGVSKEAACQEFGQLLSYGKTLICAYNAQFDLNFLFYYLHRLEKVSLLQGKDFFDALTTFKDRRPFPHKLKDAIVAYDLSDKVVNSHRALDDVRATLEVVISMAEEKQNLDKYVNLFGYNPKYGISGKRIRSITYEKQPYNGPGLVD